MSRKGENIYKRKDGRFEARYIKGYDNSGKSIYGYVYGKSYSEVKRKRNEILKQNALSKKPKDRNTSFNTILDNWLQAKQGKIKESSFSKYYYIVNNKLKKDFKKYKKYQILPQLINDYLDDLLNSGLSRNTVYSIRNILNQVLKFNNINIEIKKISQNIGTGKSIYKLDKENLEKSLLEHNSYVSLGILLSMYLGLREAEVCGLKWDDIDLENKIISINRIIVRVKSFNTKNKTKLIVSVPKTQNSIRKLPIPNKIYKILKTYKISIKEDNFLLTNTNKYMDPRTFYNKYKKILKNNNYTFHSLRHTFASSCIDIGMDYKTLMELLGHANVNTTINVYVHSSLEKKRKFINKL